MNELWRSLALLSEPPAEGHSRVARMLDLGEPAETWEYSECFLFRFYPYASVYLGAEGMMGGDARDRIAGFWRALGLTPPAEPDHLATMLSIHASLVEGEEMAALPAARARFRHARAAHFHEHLIAWLPMWLERVRAEAPPFYQRWGGLLAELVEDETRELGEPAQLPLHLREAPALPAARDLDLDGLLAFALAPLSSGRIVVRDNLVDLARRLGLGARAGERRFVLKALLSQDAAGALRGLAALARAAQLAHSRRSAPLSYWWAARAQASAALFDELGGLAAPERAEMAG